MNSRIVFMSFHKNYDSSENEKHRKNIVLFEWILKSTVLIPVGMWMRKSLGLASTKAEKSMPKERKRDQKRIKIQR